MKRGRQGCLLVSAVLYFFANCSTALSQEIAASGGKNPPAKMAEPEGLKTLPPINLKTELPHEQAKTLLLSNVYLSHAIEMNSFEAFREETKSDQEITLADAINYVLDQGMSIKISRESMRYQHFLTLAGLAGFVPSFSMQYNASHANVPNLGTTSNAQTFLTGVSFPVFQGGSVLYSLLSQRYREKAWREAYNNTVSDVFLDVYQKYMNLVLQRVLMQTYAKAVEADEEQLKLANIRRDVGTGTKYEVVQVQALLASDKQLLLQQAVTMRQASLALNLALNYPLSINLIPAERTLTEANMFDSDVSLKSLLSDAMKFGNMKQYEYFRLAAARNVQAQSASLYPTVSFFILYQINNATVNPVGNNFALGGAATSAIASFLDSTFAGRVSNNSLGQQYTFSPTVSTSTQGANTGPSAMPAASGGTPIALVQSGSLVSSGAVAPSIFGGGTGASSGANANGSLQAPSGIFPGFFKELQAGFSFVWSLPNMGGTQVASIYSSRDLARQTLLQCNQSLSVTAQTVRNDYLAVLSNREAIDSAAAAAVSNKQALDYANARLLNGVNTLLDVIHAQHDYITSVGSQAQAIVNSNVAQAQLLHDMGMISATTLTSGYHAGSFKKPHPLVIGKWRLP
jgi:outer membrane protein TolC